MSRRKVPLSTRDSHGVSLAEPNDSENDAESIRVVLGSNAVTSDSTAEIPPIDADQHNVACASESDAQASAFSAGGGATGMHSGRLMSRPLKAAPWALIGHENGSIAQQSLLDKNAVRKITGVPPRDLRVMDPTLGYPSSIMIRERALVVNLEHVKAIITADYMLLQQWDNILCAPFLRNASAKLSGREARDRVSGPPAPEDGADTGLFAASKRAGFGSSSSLVADAETARSVAARYTAAGLYGILGGAAANARGPSSGAPPPPHPDATLASGSDARVADPTLAFELRALECCLQEVVDRLCAEVDGLARTSTPVFDRLAFGVNKTLLDSARRIKTQVARVSNKVENVHDELEKLLDSEQELLDMCLTLKRQGQPTAASLDVVDTPLGFRRSSKLPSVDERDAIEDIENMLEAYFEQMDGAAKKLAELRQYIQNTEDYVAIELDSHRNQLIQLDLLLTIATLCVSCIAAIGSIFGMNVKFVSASYFDLEEDGLPGPFTFNVIVLVGVGGCIVLFALIIVYCRRLRLLCI